MTISIAYVWGEASLEALLTPLPFSVNVYGIWQINMTSLMLNNLQQLVVFFISLSSSVFLCICRLQIYDLFAIANKVLDTVT